MKKNLKKQLFKKLKVLKNKNCDTFLCKLFLNSRFKTIYSFKSLQIKISVLTFSKLKVRLSKKKIFFAQITSQCTETWRTRSVYSFFKMSRITLREHASFGLIKGLRKASW